MNQKIYTADPSAWVITIFFYLIAAFLLFCMIALGVFTFSFTLEYVLAYVSLLFLGSFFIYVAVLFSDLPSTYIELSEEGITSWGMGFIIYTPWDNIDQVAWKKGGAFPASVQLKIPTVVGGISLEEGKRQRRAVTVKRHWWMFTGTLKAEKIYTHFITVPIAHLRAKARQDPSMNQYLIQYLPQMMSTRATMNR